MRNKQCRMWFCFLTAPVKAAQVSSEEVRMRAAAAAAAAEQSSDSYTAEKCRYLTPFRAPAPVPSPPVPPT